MPSAVIGIRLAIQSTPQELGWKPKWSVRDGLIRTIEYFEEELSKHE
jgi:nucleoside-diphosphate-sugar epimerase